MSNHPSGSDQTPILMGVTWSFTLMASLFVGMRYFCRLSYQHIWWDDIWMGLTLIFSWAMSITWSVYAHIGGTQYAPLPPEQAIEVQRLNWISQCFCIAGLAIGKVAIAALILRLQAPSRVRTYVLWALCLLCVIWNGVQIILVFVQCTPTAMLWDPIGHPEGHCWDPWVVVGNAIGACAYMATLDLVLAAIPVHMIWNLQMPMKKKISVCCLLSTGVVACAMAIVKISMLPADLARNTDLVRLGVLLFVWNAIEVNVVIIAGCIPTIMPIFELLRGRSPKNNSKVTPRGRRLLFSGSGAFFSRRGFKNMGSNGKKQDQGEEWSELQPGQTWDRKSNDDQSAQSWSYASKQPAAERPVDGGIQVTSEIEITQSPRQ